MNKEKYINVYYAVSPQKMYAYNKWVAKLCFGVKPDSNQYYSFIRNSINGHFSFSINPKYYQPSSTPQTENEAQILIERLFSELKSKLTDVKENNLPKDFPIVFNQSYLRLKGVSPNYNSKGNFITSWWALYGIELQVFSTQSENGYDSKIAVLEGDSVVIQICGERIVNLHYNHTPIIDQKSFSINPDNNSEFIYKKINQKTIAPYYLSSKGYIPACNESVPILSQPIGFGWGNTKSTEIDACKSMITMSDIVPPKDGNPGLAKIVIAMDYRVITIGDGMVDNIKEVNPKEFSRLYSLGDAPGNQNKLPLKLRNLPSKELSAELLYPEEEILSTTIDNDTGKPMFTNYYNVTIKYEFALDKANGFSLWEGIKWVSQCPYSRGIYYLLPFEKAVHNWHNSSNLTIKNIRNNLPKEERHRYNREQLEDLLMTEKANLRTIALVESIVYLLINILNENSDKYSNSNLYVTIPITFYEKIINDSSFQSVLISINSIFLYKNEDDSNESLVKIEEFDTYFAFLYDIIILAKNHIDTFESADTSKDTYAAGKLNHPNIIVLNSKFFGKSGFGSIFGVGSMTATEILVHEAGHNASSEFYHTEKGDKDYEYNQTGLQSNQHNKIYPTKNNTMGIIKEVTNREHMTIL